MTVSSRDTKSNPGSVPPSTASSTARDTASPAAGQSREEFDPEHYRMSFGEHLEDLRRRLILGLAGFAVALVVCLVLGDRVVVYFCGPLIDALRDAGLNPQLHFAQLTAGFTVYIKVSLMMAFAFAGPWMAYQLWQFVAAGLYRSERKVVTRFIPLSLGLLMGGMALAFYVVMPLTVRFLLAFSSGYAVPGVSTNVYVDTGPEQVVRVPTLAGDPKSPQDGQIWHNSHDGRVKMFIANKTVALPFNSDSLLAQSLTIDEYVDLTIMTLIVFGLAFQLPLVVLALFVVGILDLEMLRGSRRVVYLALSVIAAAIAPGDVISTMMALYIPLILLFEFGIFLCVMSQRRQGSEAAA